MKQALAAATEKKRIAVVCAHDAHTIEAVSHAVRDGLVKPVLIGDESRIRTLLPEYGIAEADVQIIQESDDSAAAQLAADMARKGEADAVMKGGLETGTLMKVLVNKERGINKGSVMNIIAVYDAPMYHKLLCLTDPGILIRPDLAQKEAQIINCRDAMKALGIDEPKVALISAVETINPKMQDTLDAAAMKAKGVPGCILEGPISIDLALSKEAAEVKRYDSPVAGDADLLVMPDMVSANTASKMLTTLSDTQVCGVVLGALVPVILVSRSASAVEKYMSIVLGALIGRSGI